MTLGSLETLEGEELEEEVLDGEGLEADGAELVVEDAEALLP